MVINAKNWKLFKSRKIVLKGNHPHLTWLSEGRCFFLKSSQRPMPRNRVHLAATRHWSPSLVCLDQSGRTRPQQKHWAWWCPAGHGSWQCPTGNRPRCSSGTAPWCRTPSTCTPPWASGTSTWTWRRTATDPADCGPANPARWTSAWTALPPKAGDQAFQQKKELVTVAAAAAERPSVLFAPSIDLKCPHPDSTAQWPHCHLLLASHVWDWCTTFGGLVPIFSVNYRHRRTHCIAFGSLSKFFFCIFDHFCFLTTFAIFHNFFLKFV